MGSTWYDVTVFLQKSLSRSSPTCLLFLPSILKVTLQPASLLFLDEVLKSLDQSLLTSPVYQAGTLLRGGGPEM